LSEKEKERFDHIPDEQMLHILDQKDFSNSIADLVQAISFNPRAPENMTWCVNDKTAEAGAIKYSSDYNMLIRESTAKVISDNIKDIIFPVTDIFKKIHQTTKFNPQQNINYDKYFDIIGQPEIRKEYINSIKERAYIKRGLCTALWDDLNIPLQTQPIKLRHKRI